ncbi:lytic transglycosylase domain-containing protein [Methylobacterium sp. M6A4_1b]
MRSIGVGLVALLSIVAVEAGAAPQAPGGEAELLAQLRAGSGTTASQFLMPTSGSTLTPQGSATPRFLQASAAGPVAFAPLVEAAAHRHGIAIDFFKRLIRQESGYNPNAVSSAGAQGIAQFMPGTAAMMGLDDPFDPAKALPKSAELLAALHRRLGNEGLAAAAYNAGEGRVRAWLSGQGGLPLETRNYVRAITGREAEEWAPANLSAILVPVSLPAARRSAFTGASARISPEWAFALTILPSAAANSAFAKPAASRPAQTAQAAARPGRRVGRPVSGEAALCEGMRSTGCIVAAVY